METKTEKLTHEVIEIMNDLETESLTIECCDVVVNGDLLTHCYHIDGKLVFTSGDMENDKHAEEILLTNEETIEVLENIIECYD